MPVTSAGWCIFNDLAVAGKAVQRDAAVGQLLMLDLDVHQGDGSATIFAGTCCDQLAMFLVCWCCIHCGSGHGLPVLALGAATLWHQQYAA